MLTENVLLIDQAFQTHSLQSNSVTLPSQSEGDATSRAGTVKVGGKIKAQTG
jgi:hypothetical protein